MKKSIFVAALFLAASFVSFAQENILKNGAFEDGVPAVVTGQKKTIGSWLGFYHAQRGGMTIDEVEGKEGKGIKVSVDKVTKPVWDNYIYQNISLTPGEYEVSYWVKAAKTAAERTSLRFNIKPSTRSYLGENNSPFSPKKKVTTDWQQVVQKVKIADDQEGLEEARFIISFEEEGNEFFIDQVELKKIK